jgi:hypothetical protein
VLTIRKFREKTPEEMQREMNERNYMRWFPDNREVSKENQTDLLDVCITEEQFDAIRKAVLEKF